VTKVIVRNPQTCAASIPDRLTDIAFHSIESM
jgi:hypothetical protein